MLYTFLISIVFIAELVILFSLISALLRLDKMLISLDKTVTETKPGIKDIGQLVCKISEQWVELAEDWVESVKEKEEDMLIRQINKMLIAILLWKINSKHITRFRRSKLARTLKRGFAFVQSMV